MPQQPQSFPAFTAAILCGFAVLMFALGGKGVAPTPPVPAPVPVAGDPDFLPVFLDGVARQVVTYAEAKQHAAELAAINEQLAHCLRFDATKQRIKTGVQVGALRGDLRELATDGWSFASKYPLIRSTLTEYLDRSAGKDARELTPDQRERWAAAHEAIARAARYAESKL